MHALYAAPHNQLAWREIPKFAQYISLGIFFFLFKGRKYRMIGAFVFDPTRALSKTNLRDDTTLDGLRYGDKI